MITPNPQPSGRVQQRPPKGETKRPETIQLMLKMWLLAAILEAVHQVTTIGLSLTNADVLITTARKQLEEAEQPMAEAVAPVIGYGSIFIGALIAFAVVGLLIWMLHILRTKGKRAGMARRIWFAFSIYFGLRLLLTFLATPAGSSAPDWLIMLDGILVILTGVAAILGLVFSLRRETLDYTGELEQLKQYEKEQRAALEEKQREKNEKQHKDAERDRKAGKRK